MSHNLDFKIIFSNLLSFHVFFRCFLHFNSSIDTVTNVSEHNNFIAVAKRKRLLDFAVHLFLEDQCLHINIQSLVTHFCPVGGVSKVILYKYRGEQSVSIPR